MSLPLIGGIEIVIDKALEMSFQGKDKIAAHLIETAFYADETNEANLFSLITSVLVSFILFTLTRQMKVYTKLGKLFMKNFQ